MNSYSQYNDDLYNGDYYLAMKLKQIEESKRKIEIYESWEKVQELGSFTSWFWNQLLIHNIPFEYLLELINDMIIIFNSEEKFEWCKEIENALKNISLEPQ